MRKNIQEDTMNNEFNFQSDPYTGFHPTEKKPKNGYAIASLVLGIISVASCCCCCNTSITGLILMGVCAILAIVFAFVSKKNSSGKMDGKAIAGLVLGIVAIVILLLFLVAVVGTYSLLATMPEEEMLAFLEENFKPLAPDEETYNELVEAIKAIYEQRAGQ